MMSATIISREEVARQLAVPKRLLVRVRARGLCGSSRKVTSRDTPRRDSPHLGDRQLSAGSRYQSRRCRGDSQAPRHLSDVHHRLDTLAHLLNEALDESAEHSDA